MDLLTATAEDFRPLIGEVFTVDTQEPAELTLVEVESTPQADGTAREPFALLFKGANQLTLPQGIYGLAHAATGTLEIFLVPVEQDGQNIVFEAVFS